MSASEEDRTIAARDEPPRVSMEPLASAPDAAPLASLGAPGAHGRAAFAFIFVTVLLDMIALGIMLPVLPQLVVQLEGGAFARAARITGLFGFAWAAMQFICAPLIGALSDRFGRRPVVLLSNFGLGLDYLVMAVAPTVAWLFLGRVISGMTSSSYPTAMAYATDVTSPAERAGRYGLLGAAFGLGFVIGPAIGGFLGDIDLRLPFWVAAGFSLLNAAYGFFILPESLPRERRVRVPWHMANPVGSLSLLRSRPALVGLAMAAFLYLLSHEVLPSLFALYTQYRYAWSSAMVGLSLTIVGVCSTIVSAVVIGPAAKRFGERRTLFAGLAFSAASYVAFGLAPTGALYLAGIPLASLAGLTYPSLQALVTSRVGESEQGQLQGAMSSLQGIAMMAGPLLFTQLFALSLRRGGRPASGAAFLVAALLIVGALVVVARARSVVVQATHA